MTKLKTVTAVYLRARVNTVDSMPVLKLAATYRKDTPWVIRSVQLSNMVLVGVSGSLFNAATFVVLVRGTSEATLSLEELTPSVNLRQWNTSNVLISHIFGYCTSFDDKTLSTSINLRTPVYIAADDPVSIYYNDTAGGPVQITCVLHTTDP